MYYLLNYIPMFIQTIMFLLHIWKGIVLHGKMQEMYAIYLLLITPIYLIIVNGYYLKRESISFLKSMIFMTSVIIYNTLAFMIYHKIKTGYFIGDVPEGVYYLLFFIPFSIIIVGITIAYFIIRKNR